MCNSFNIIILNIVDYNLLIVCIQHYSCDTGACLVCYINFLSVLDVKQAALLNRFLVILSFLLKSSLSLTSNCPSLQLLPLQACNTHINIHTPRHMLVSLVLLLLLALSICSLSLSNPVKPTVQLVTCRVFFHLSSESELRRNSNGSVSTLLG